MTFLRSLFLNPTRPIRSVFFSFCAYGFIYILAMNYLNIYLFPRRALVEVSLPAHLKDKGVFADLNKGLTVPVPLWLPKEEFKLELSPRGNILALHFSDHILALFAWDRLKDKSKDRSKSKSAIHGLSEEDYEILEDILDDHLPQKLERAIKKGRAKKGAKRWRDHDQDQIPDSLDIQIGLVKSMKNHARYDASYHGVSYPNGDVKREVGVCTDVVIRAYRNAGINLQKLLFEDMNRSPQSYRFSGPKPNKHYEHRRVRQLHPYFRRHYQKLSSKFDPNAKGKQAWLPGDLLFMDLLGRKTATHVGLVSGHTQLSGYPLLAHNAAHFFYASEHDVLFARPIISRFRITLPK